MVCAQSEPTPRSSAAPWELQVVLEGLSGPPFELLDRTELSCLSFKTFLMFASAKRARELCVLSIHPSCMSFSSDGGLEELWPNQAFQPRVSRVICLGQRCHPPTCHVRNVPECILHSPVHRAVALQRGNASFCGFRRSSVIMSVNGVPFPPPISKYRVLWDFPKCYTPEASLQLKQDWEPQTKAFCKDRASRNQPWDRQKTSKVVVVGDLNVGKTCLINRFCKDVFVRDYKATIGVDFEIERFEMSGVPFSLQIWDTAGQEKFKCIASAYYRGAQVIVTVFDMADIKSLDNTRQWLEEAMRETHQAPASSS
ncbi:hypothetical protein WMY93_032120 [Mugilogobius chulae]|uniref:Ras-related protein Rab-36 n=1 Tax=Mugilogobius chulae TaxID=88201 RepID=A0AAW0MD71_9GOBI